MTDNYWTRRGSRRGLLAGMGIAGAGAATLALAGCGDDDEDDKPTPGSGATTAASPTQGGGPAPTATPADFLARIPENPPDATAEKDFKTGGRTTRIHNRPWLWDMLFSTGVAAYAEVLLPVYSKLIRLANHASMKSVMAPTLEGDIATKWEQPDPLTIVLTLTPGVKYQNVAPLNGRELKVDDIRYHFNRAKTHQKSAWKGYFQVFDSVEDVGNNQVRLKLARVYPPAQQVLGLHVMALIPPELGNQDNLSTAVGTGPFIMDKATPNVGVDYKKNPDYFKKDSAGRQRPYLDAHTLSIVNDPATAQALVEGGRIDAAYSTITPIGLENAEDILKRNPNIVLQRRPSANPSFYLAGIYDRAPWSDPRVRRAVNLLMDRASIIKALYRGYGMTGPFFPWPVLFDKAPAAGSPELGPNYRYDPKEAKTLLSAAGFANGLDLDLHWFESGSTTAQIAQVFQQNAAEAGVKINLIKSPDNTAHFRKQTEGNWSGLLQQGRGLDFVDPQATMSYFLPGNPLNAARVNDPELVRLNTQLESTTGDPRRAVMRQIYDRLNSEVYEVAYPSADFLTFFSSRLHNFRDTSWAANTGFGMGAWDQVWVSS